MRAAFKSNNLSFVIFTNDYGNTLNSYPDIAEKIAHILQ